MTLKSIGKIGFTTLLSLGIVLSSLVIWRLPLLNWVLPQILHAQGLPPLTLVIHQLDLNQLVLGPGGDPSGQVTWQQLQVVYTPEQLIKGKITALRLQGLRAQVEQKTDGTLHLPLALPPQKPTANATTSDSKPIHIPSLPLDQVVLEDAQLEVKTPYGVFTPHIEGLLENRLSHLHGHIQVHMAGLDLNVRAAVTTQTPYTLELKSDLKLQQFQAPLPGHYHGTQLTGLVDLQLDGPLQAMLDQHRWPRMKLEHHVRVAHSDHPGYMLLKGETQLKGDPQGTLALNGTLGGAALQGWLKGDMPIPTQTQISGRHAYQLSTTLQALKTETLQPSGWSHIGVKLTHPQRGDIKLAGTMVQPAGEQVYTLQGHLTLNQFKAWPDLLPPLAHTQLDGKVPFTIAGISLTNRHRYPKITLKPDLLLTPLRGGAPQGKLQATLQAEPYQKGLKGRIQQPFVLTAQAPLPKAWQPLSQQLGADGQRATLSSHLSHPLQLIWDGDQTVTASGALNSQLSLSAGPTLTAQLQGQLTSDLSNPRQESQFRIDQLTLTSPKLTWQKLHLKQSHIKVQLSGRANAYQGRLLLKSQVEGMLPPQTVIQQGKLDLNLAFKGNEHAVTANVENCFNMGYHTIKPVGGVEMINKGNQPLCIQSERIYANWQQATQPHLALQLQLAPHRMDIELTSKNGEPQRVQMRTPMVTQRLTGHAQQWQSHTTLKGGRFKLKGADLIVRDLDLTLQAAQNHGKLNAQGEVSHITLRPMASTGEIAPFHYGGQLLLADNAFTLDGQLSDLKGLFAVDLLVKHDLQNGEGVASIQMDPVFIQQKGTQPQDLFRMLRGQIESVEGEVELSGHLNWGAAEDSAFALRLNGLGLQTTPARIEGLDLELDLSSLRPPQSRHAQRLHIDLLDIGIPVRNIEADLHLQRDGIAQLQQMTIPFAGGWIKAHDATFDLKSARHDLLLEVEDVDLSAIAGLVKLPGLKATGLLQGRLPVKMVGGRIFVEQATLFTKGRGMISNKTVAAATLKAGGAQPSLVAKAMENLQYERLKVTLDGDLAGDLNVRMEAVGKNPDLYKGHPLVLNFSVQGALGDLISKELEGFDIPGMLQREGILKH
ncbi:intermembrane phospholipid transport protein YdbH family protein [Magnetococcus sp. PR-3]|uniref:intermembrane phospholipid transport protein YdbH family protein n=1 Tax=Magnetococcus sp. PR-3 TaxID=3120355 RepID=UPI002FCE3E12